MKTRKLFRTGRCTVVAIPKSYLEAMRLLPGSMVVLTIKDRAITLSKAVVMSETLLGAPVTPDRDVADRKESR